MTKAASDASGFYRLPSNRVLELGQQLGVTWGAGADGRRLRRRPAPSGCSGAVVQLA